MQLARYNAHQSSAYTIVKGLSPLFGTLALQDATTDYQAIIDDARAREPASSLPPDVDPTVLAGYTAQREVLLQQFQNPNLAVGVLYWDSSTQAQVYHLKPFSRGNLTINSTDPLANPVIDYRTATDPTDFAVIVALFRRLRAVMAAPSMTVLGPIEASPLSGKVQTDEEIIAVARDTLIPTNSHQCCSAPMLPLKLGGVVSADHKVYGVARLRVADISHFPIALSTGPTASVYAAAEKVIFPEQGL